MPIDNNPYTMTPGSAVADQLQDILTRKRVESRQNMMDQLYKQNLESEMQYRQDQAETNRMYREAYGDERSAIAEKRRAEIDQMHRRQQALAGFKNSPAYAGLTPQQRSAFDIAAADEDPTALRTMIGKMLTPEKRQGGYIWTMGRDGAPYNTGEFMEGVSGDQFHPPPAQERPQPQQHFQDLGPEEDEAGKPTGNRVILDLNTAKITTVPVRIGRKGGPTKPVLPFDQHQLDRYSAAIGNKKATSAAKAQALRAFIATLPDKGLNSALSQFLTPEALAKNKMNPFTMTASQLTQGDNPVIAGLSPQQVQDLDQILTAIRPSSGQ